MSLTAAERLGRILHVLAVAQRSGGTTIDAIADELGIAPGDVLADLAEVQDRSFYHPAGFAEDVQVTIDRDRVSVFAGRKFLRPPRLTAGEAVAVELALRTAAARDADRAGRLNALARRIRPAVLDADVSERIAPVTDGQGDPVAGVLRRAVRERRTCTLRYARPGMHDPAVRIVRPYALVHAEGAVYLIGHCEGAGSVRSFRLDRIVDCSPAEGSFAVPTDFSIDDHITGGRVFTPPADAVEAEVRYAPAIARWIAEREEGAREEPDGSVVVRHPVADPGWLVRHVLQYGAEAEVLAPEALRERMRDVLAGLTDA